MILAIICALFLTTSTSSNPEVHNQYLNTAKEKLAKQPDPARWLITVNGKPTERLIMLLKMDALYDPNDHLEEIVAKTQKAWVQTIQGQNNKERTDLIDTAQQEKNRQDVEKIVQEIGLFDARTPALKHYDYGACLGGYVDGVRKGLAELIEQWQKGVRFDSLIFFTGERYLRKEPGREDSLERLCNPESSLLPLKAGWKMPEDAPYETEYDMCKLIWDQTEIPEDMRLALADRVVFVNAARPANRERPSTKDAYRAWIEENNPAPGTVLAISHPLLWTYQQIAGENSLGPNYPLDTCAKAVSEEDRKKHQQRIVSLVQDTVGKCLYELLERQKPEDKVD